MIPPHVVRGFLNRRFDNHSWMKDLDECRLDQALAALRPRPNLPEFGIQQKVGFLLGVRYPGFFFTYDMGTGKTYLSLKLLEYGYQAGELSRLSVILMPTDTAVYGWLDEFTRWRPSLPVLPLLGTTAQKWAALREFRHGAVLMTYIGYASMVSEIQQVTRRRQERVPVVERLEWFQRNTDALVMDQSTACGNPASLTFQTVLSLSFGALKRYALSGRPFGRDPFMLWPQSYLVDHGASLGDHPDMFLQTFFERKREFWGSPKWIPIEDRKPEMARAFAHRSLYYSIHECVDMPSRTTSIRRVDMSTEQSNYYYRLTDALVSARGNFREVENAFIRMRQITSGFLGFVDDDTGERAQLEFEENPKLDDLMDLLEDMPDGECALIFHDYTWTGARICRELAARNMRHGWLWGGSKDWPQTKDRFEHDPKFKALVLNHRKGGMALNLQRASYVHFFESPVSPMMREESERRAYRQGQVRKVHQYDIISRGSIDESILAFHREGGELMEALVADPVRVLSLRLPRAAGE